MLNTDNTLFTLPESETTTDDILVSENAEQTLSNKKFKDNNNNEYTIDEIPKLNKENIFTATLSAPSITLNNTDLQTTLNNCAKLDVSNTFTAAQTINVSTTGNWFRSLQIMDNTMANGNGVDILFGKSDNSKNVAEICYHHEDDGSNSNNITLGFHSCINQTLTADGTTKTAKLETTQTTPNNAFGDNLKKCMLQLMYPVGSIYMSATSQSNPNDIFGVNIGTWVRISSGWAYAAEASDTLVANGGKGGSWTHAHTYGIRHGGWYGCMTGTTASNSDAIEIMNGDSSWTKTTSRGYGDGKVQVPYTTTIYVGHQYQGTAQTSSVSIGSAIPWFRVAMWYRSA